MSAAIFSSPKTHPADDQTPSTWFDLNKAGAEMQPPVKIEIVVERQQIGSVENPLHVQRTTIGTVDNNQVDNQFPSIERSAPSSINAVELQLQQQQQTIKVPSDLNLDRSSATGVSGATAAAREWKRDKTFDGCPIFCVCY